MKNPDFGDENDYGLANEALGPGARVTIELDAAAARDLVQIVLAVLDEAKTSGFVE